MDNKYSKTMGSIPQTEPQFSPPNIEKSFEQEIKLDNIKEIGTQNVPDVPSNIHYVTIIGHIEGHAVAPPQSKSTKYEHIIPQLIAVEENPKIGGMITILNTIGGDVEAGLAIAELISSMSKPTVSLVLGGGHSIGVPLATASNYSFIAPTATMTIHPIRMNGLVIGVPQTFKYFEKMQERILQFITRTSKVSRDVIVNLMTETDEIANDVGTILIGKEAVDVGLIDQVGGLNDALTKLKELIQLQEDHRNEIVTQKNLQ
ncbi:ClpP family protease [Marinisporobacter balticus]|uniref:ATP-dependent Clp protease proteolytic subunit ClpP n=1 Tax=Marinisporobacter balticus TaxID=2018667 RepID=A0A4R2LAU0_9FIRM|nr:ATP-dependent Clp protease proteolytic subunit [Marinisporobacter balticus]TCO79888.1 ATP-dependent Clp protease proteolytic subunit ClpP [Marinisporobacter balticus]